MVKANNRIPESLKCFKIYESQERFDTIFTRVKNTPKLLLLTNFHWKYYTYACDFNYLSAQLCKNDYTILAYVSDFQKIFKKYIHRREGKE